jgi:hypothetical protein
MMRVIAYPVMMLAAVGILASCFLYIGSFATGPELGRVASRFLFPGIFVVWLPTVLLMNWLARGFKPRDLWKAALRGCPAVRLLHQSCQSNSSSVGKEPGE